ncbi:MAG TPA: type II toxin-antitoxin system RelE/ParE family toxin [Candidatus Saccharimonadales bacterium]
MTASYKVLILPVVIRKDSRKIPKLDLKRIMDKINSLGFNPRPTWAIKLSSREEYRGRQGVYRILYVIDDGVKIVQVTKVRHRKDVYK